MAVTGADRARRRIHRERIAAWHEKLRDPALTTLLLFELIILFLILPLASSGVAIPRLTIYVVLFAAVSLVVLVSHGRRTAVLAVAVLLLSVGGVVAREHAPGQAAYIASGVGAVFALSVVSVVVSAAVYGPGRVTGHRIRGAIVLYINIALIFAAIYRTLEELLPGSIAGVGPSAETARFEASLVYFSFTTITSVGYGDLVPVHAFTRSFATLEAMIGQLFPATLLARIVTLEIAHRRS